MKRLFKPLFGSLKFIKAFTLAETLMTLTIIGIVAIVTIPSVTANYKKMVLETKLKKFYLKMNETISLAEMKCGNRKKWYSGTMEFEYDDDGNLIVGSSNVEKWWNKCISPYIKTTSVEHINDGRPIFHLADGTTVAPSNTEFSVDWRFYPGDFEKCFSKPETKQKGQCSFMFHFVPYSDVPKDRDFHPYRYTWDGTREGLFGPNESGYGCAPSEKCDGNSNCMSFCTMLIQYNNWKVPKDYPLKLDF